ncbi:MAG: hypothetical protein M0T85_04065 [Dehalococcoidales bacterium]|nr:hypothetical protein [Dehalococcoidales bacterium]
MFFFVDASPATIEHHAATNLSIPVRESTSFCHYWQSLNQKIVTLDGLSLTLIHHSAPDPRPAYAPPPEEPPAFTIDLLDDGFDADGRWSQKLKITIKPDGTLAEVSEAIYGDVLHADELLELVKQQIPGVQRPQQLRVGHSFEVNVDPTSTFIVKETQWDEAEGKLTRRFFNGGKEVTYPNIKSGTLWIIDFPSNGKTESFTFKIGDEVLVVQPGSRLAEYAYRSGDTFDGVVKKIYDSATAKALQDFILQTKWTPDQWPPPASEKRRLIIPAAFSWEDAPPQSIGSFEERIFINERYHALMEQRRDAGIFPLAREATGTTYRVQITDPKLSARDISRLLYGSDDKYLSLVDQAGISIPHDASGGVPENFNPPLLGRVFDVYVDYVDEWFLLEPPRYDAKVGRKITRLSNGTTIEEYDRSTRNDSGLQRAIYYPTGYKKIVYRPSNILYTSLDFLYFVSNGLHSDRSSDEGKKKIQDFAASFIWTWAPGIPRDYGDNPESFKVSETPETTIVEIVVSPRPSSSPAPALLYDLWRANPCLSAVGVLFLATIVMFVVGTLFRRR